MNGVLAAGAEVSILATHLPALAEGIRYRGWTCVMGGLPAGAQAQWAGLLAGWMPTTKWCYSCVCVAILTIRSISPTDARMSAKSGGSPKIMAFVLS